jgi:hypothetical protein
MYYIQFRELSTGTWHRDTDEDAYGEPLPALERRDEIRADFPNDGLQRGVRVVSSAGDVIEYGERHLSSASRMYNR